MGEANFLKALETALDRIWDLQEVKRGHDCSSDGSHGSLHLTMSNGDQFLVSFNKV